MNWAVAHRIAGIAAAQAHRDLGIDRTHYVPARHSSVRQRDVDG